MNIVVKIRYLIRILFFSPYRKVYKQQTGLSSITAINDFMVRLDFVTGLLKNSIWSICVFLVDDWYEEENHSIVLKYYKEETKKIEKSLNTVISRLPSLEEYLLRNPSLRIVDPLEKPLKEFNKQTNSNLRIFDIFDINILSINKYIPGLEDIINKCRISLISLSPIYLDVLRIKEVSLRINAIITKMNDMNIHHGLPVYPLIKEINF